MHPRHISGLVGFNAEEFDALFAAARLRERLFDAYRDALRTRVVALYFATPSFRTQMSFASATLRLGGNTLDVPNAIAREDIIDVAHQLSFYAHYVVVRLQSSAEFDVLTSHSRVPVISAGHGATAHPTTGITQLFSIHEHIGRLEDLTLLIIAKLPKRGVNSLLEGLSLYTGNRVFVRTPPTRRLSAELEARLTAEGRNSLEYVSSLKDIADPRCIDAVFVDDSNSDLQPNSKQEGFWTPELSKDFVGLLPESAIITAGLPRTQMLPRWLDADPRSHYVTKSEYGTYLRAALLLLLEGQLK